MNALGSALSKFLELRREEGLWRAFRLAIRYVFGTIRLLYLKRIARVPDAVCRVNGYKMTVMLNRHGLAEELMLIGYHEKLTTRELESRLKQGMHIIEIGANIGYYVLLEALACGESGKIYAIEPVPENFALLERNVALNGMQDRVSLYRMALGERCGTVPMTLSTYMSQHTFMNVIPGNEAGTLEVPMTTFSQFVRDEKVDLEKLTLIRMDIEGYEAKLIPDMAGALQGRRGVGLLIELHPKQINQAAGCSFNGTLMDLSRLSDTFDWALVAEGHRKRISRNLPIAHVMNTGHYRELNKFEVWLTIQR